MADETKESEPELELAFPAERPSSVDVFYDRSRQHRTIYSDGVWAGITPSSEIQIVFFKNLTAVPEYIRQEVNPDGGLGKEVDKSVRNGLIREYEATVVLNKETAEAMVTLLQDILQKRQAIEDRLKKSQE